MPEKSQIPFLVQLLDDESPRVREQIIRELLAYGPTLEEELDEFDDVITHRQRMMVRSVMSSRRGAAHLREEWRMWPSIPDEGERLEKAFDLLAQIQYGWAPPIRLRDMLDELAAAFLSGGLPTDPVGLSRFLFTRRLRGSVEDYYNPFNSNLVHVIQTGKGLPISLACIFILVGRRVGLEIHGCCVPGHFLARASMHGRDVYFDCFNRGRILTSTEVEDRRAGLAPHQQHLLTEPASAVAVVTRVLLNLQNAYDLAEDPARVEMVQDLLAEMRQTAPAL